MTEDRSLDDFVGADASGEEDEAVADADEIPGDDESADDEADNKAGEADDRGTTDDVADQSPADGDDDAAAGDDGATKVDGSDAVEPPSITGTWDTDGVACERCETEVERRWECDGDYVCADCKDW